MTDTQSRPEWRVIGETVPGASHLRAGIPNQDAIFQVRESGRELPLVVSVSDGHGSDKCFRSDRGSRFAVRRAAQLVGEFLDERRGPLDLSGMEGELKERVPAEFVRRWREAVEADLKTRPFTAEELDTLEKKDDARARRLVEDNPLIAYGATSLTVAVEESFILYLQLGDGEIITVSESGEVTKALPGDSRLFANETTSLCTPDAEKNFRSRLQPLTNERPALILLSTDGYANSFSDEAGFLKVGADLLEMMRADGLDSVNASLKGWLEEATRTGSGDDTTVSVVCRMDALQKLPLTVEGVPAAPEQKETASAAVDETQAASASPKAQAANAPSGAPAEGKT
ncbi:MAG TPA: PP2C family serine/threonine-protein phosphatase [Pyrinomonadaceae bacterium]